MSLKYLLDENINPVYKIQLRKRLPDLTIKAIGEPATPPKGALDPEILIWCEEYGFVLVTNNRKSMPIHLADHLAMKHHIPGIFILGTGLSIGENLEQLIFIAEASFEDEYQDQIVYLPRI